MMNEIVITILYWLLNAMIILGGLFYAYEVLQEKRKAMSSVFLFVFGVAWHAFRGITEYRKGACDKIEENNGWLSIANQCIPYTDPDVILAQIAILSGVFVFIALIAKRYHGN